ncbi:MAG: carbonic anhydrase [Acidimicrobiia bacterium]|nr:carbonic anhydrase [Acidimicrobiia bacterium]
MTGSDDLIRQARSATVGALPKSPRMNTAVIACIDARVEPNRVLGGDQGDYHVIRNAGGLVTDDALRSLMVSQSHGTTRVIVMMHTDCAAMAYPAAAERARLEQETGQRIEFKLHPFDDLETELHRGVAQLRSTPFLPHTENIRGVIYDVETGRVRTVVD